MLTQYFNHFAKSFDKNTLDQIQKVATSKEGAIGIASAIVLMAGLSVYNSNKFDRGCPKVPDSHFIYGSSLEYRKDPQAFIEKWRKELGDVYCANLFGEETVVVSGPQVREVFLDDRLSFLEGVMRNFNVLLLTNSAFTVSDSADSLTDLIKKFLNPNLKHYTPRLISYLTSAFHEFAGDVPAEGKDIYHAYPMIQHMVATASAAVFVGPELAKNEQLIDSFKNMVIEVGSELTPKPLMEYLPNINYLRMWYIGKTSPKVKKHRTQLADSLKPEIDRRLKAMALNDSNWDRPDDILQNIIECQERPKHLDVHLYTLEVLTQFIFAALHTTSENGTVAFYRIMNHPGLIEELLEEQNQVLESEGFDKNCGPEVFTREILNKFVKLDSAIREAFRVKNSYIDLGHKNMSNENIVLSGGAVIRPGEIVHPNIYANHNDPSLQKVFDDLKEYKPLRFLNAERNSTKIGDDFLFFGLGRHSCPGRWFAVQEIKTIISYIIRKYQVVPQGDITFPTQDRVSMPMGVYKLVPRK
ncbi:cytochrome P450 [Cunninghamella echinulata]|nr:cytochrome P450 [Cunninghamella echinulata]